MLSICDRDHSSAKSTENASHVRGIIIELIEDAKSGEQLYHVYITEPKEQKGLHLRLTR